jgi:hypothetical protein
MSDDQKPVCEVCGRPEGDESDGPPPLGALEKCDVCGRLVCPDCLCEADCCFLDAEDHADDPAWAPPGWRLVPGGPYGEAWERLPR